MHLWDWDCGLWLCDYRLFDVFVTEQYRIHNNPRYPAASTVIDYNSHSHSHSHHTENKNNNKKIKHHLEYNNTKNINTHHHMEEYGLSFCQRLVQDINDSGDDGWSSVRWLPPSSSLLPPPSSSLSTPSLSPTSIDYRLVTSDLYILTY
jgi:hypothetical protein